LNLDRGAASFDEDGVAPASVVLADALAGADVAESGSVVEGQAGGVFREDAGLDGPDPGCFGGGVDAISDLDLSYTPPLGGPWDAVQIGAQAWVR
jgi:hypothetical protein